VPKHSFDISYIGNEASNPCLIVLCAHWIKLQIPVMKSLRLTF